MKKSKKEKEKEKDIWVTEYEPFPPIMFITPYNPICKCTPDETTGYTDFQDGFGKGCNICGGKVL